MKVVIPTKVVIPVTVNLFISREAEVTPTVTIPADIGVTDKFCPKSIVPAVPTTLPSFFTTTPEPDPITLVNPEPSPINVAVTPLGPLNDVALIIPVILTLPVPVIDLLNKSRFPPS